MLQKPKIENVNTNNNNRIIFVGTSFWGKFYLMSRIVSRIPNRDFYIMTKSPSEQYTNSKNKIKKIEEGKKTLKDYENVIKVFDDILGSTTSQYIDQLFKGGRHIKLDIYYLSQSYFDLPKRNIRKNKVKNFSCLIKR